MKAIVPSSRGSMQRLSMDQLAAIPEEQVWLASRKSARTRRAYQNDVAHFMRTFDIRSPEELRKIDHRAVMAWEQTPPRHPCHQWELKLTGSSREKSPLGSARFPL